MKKSWRGEVEYKGRRYENLKQLSKEMGMDLGTLYGRLQRGMSLEEALNKPLSDHNKPKEVYCYGERFESISALARKYGLDPETVSRRISRSLSIEEAVMLEKRKGKDLGYEVEYKGKKYKNLNQLAKELGVPYGLIYKNRGELSRIEKDIQRYKENKSDSIEFFGEIYSDMFELAKKYGITREVLKDRLAKGWSLEDAVLKPPQEGRKTPVEYRGKQYRSIRELALERGIHPVALARRIRSGMSVEEAVEYRKYEEVECHGKKYDGLKGVAEAYGIGYVTLKKRLDKGMTLEEAVEKSELVLRVVEYRGKKYGSVTELAREVGIPPQTLNVRIRRGMDLEEAVSSYLNMNYKPVVYKSVYYDNISELARAYGMRPASLIARMNRGMNLEEAMEIPMIPKPKGKRR